MVDKISLLKLWECNNNNDNNNNNINNNKANNNFMHCEIRAFSQHV